MAALPPKEKRPAAMAPRMQTQVQKWAKMTAELGDRGAEADLEVLDDVAAAAEPAMADRKRKRTKSSRRAAAAAADAKAQALLRAPHRRDRYSSLAVGEGLPLPGSFANSSSDGPSTPVPPTCLLCLARFASLQQLRDHESLSAYHRRQLHDPAARRAGMQRYARVAEKTRAAAASAGGSGDEADKPVISSRIPVHMKRIPRRRGDLAPVYTSYAVPVRLPADEVDADADPETTAGNADAPDAPALYHHTCLLCRRRFRNVSSLRLHERESALHRARTRDPAAVAAAAEAVHIAAPPRPLLRMHPVAPSSGSAMLYRDRARERRLAFGQTGVPGRRTRGAKPGGAPSTATASAAPAEPPLAASKGAAMLGKMGWSAGLGLGAAGTGATAAIAPTAYMPGVGLGAQGGRLGDAADVAARRTESTYADFVEQTQETARQRFIALGRAEEEEAKAAEVAAAEAAAAEAAAAEEAAADEANGDGNEMETESRE